jgi:AraC-like DNA-binding protein
MVSIRCKMIVAEELRKLGLQFLAVELGEVDVTEEMTATQHEQFRSRLLYYGLELMDDRKAVLIERIKVVIVELVHFSDNPLKVKFSNYLSEKLQHDYTYMANLFSEVQGTTIEQFLICHRVERVKELIMYDELNITEIAWKMNYSSVAHLCTQFKKVTGLTPTHFKQLKSKRRSYLEEIGSIASKVPAKAIDSINTRATLQTQCT